MRIVQIVAVAVAKNAIVVIEIHFVYKVKSPVGMWMGYCRVQTLPRRGVSKEK